MQSEGDDYCTASHKEPSVAYEPAQSSGSETKNEKGSGQARNKGKRFKKAGVVLLLCGVNASGKIAEIHRQDRKHAWREER